MMLEKKVDNWLDNNKLQMNLDKTKFINFKSKYKTEPQTLIEIKFKGIQIEQTKEYKYLGIQLDQHLSFEKHIELLKNKLSSHIGVFKRLTHIRNSNILKNIYFALIQPHLNYG